MRRKSTRNAQKATPDKTVKETEPSQKTRRSRRRKRSPSKSSESEDEVLTVTKRAPVEETPDTTTKSHTPTDDETSEEPMWKVTPTTEESPKGEIQKLKLCLTRPSPDSPDKSKSRRSKSNSQTEDDATSSEDKSSSRRTRSQGSPIVRNDGLSSQEGDEDVEEKKGKGKSKGKHKSKIEKSPHVSEPELQTNNEISENVQVTPQSPSIDKPVDNENDCKVDVNNKQNINESVQGHEIVNEENVTNDSQDSDKVQDSNVKTQTESQVDIQSDKESDDDQPLSVIQTSASESKEKSAETEPQLEIVLKDEENVSETKEETLKQTEPEQSIVQSETEKKEDDESSTLEKQELTEESIEPSKNEETSETKEPSPDENTPTENVSQEENLEDHTTDTTLETTESSQPTDSNTEESPTKPVQEEVPQAAKVTEERRPSTKSSVPRRRLKRNNEYVQPNSDKKEETSEQISSIKPSGTKRKWKNERDPCTLIKLDLESIQAVCPTIDFPEEPDLNLEIEKERRKSITEPNKNLERKVSVEYKSDYSERTSFEKQTSVSSAKDSDDNSNIIAFNRKISIVDDTASKLKPPPSPAKNPVSNILYIINLVRPFTVKQLKELLERTGKIREEGFWTDRIKSKCYVQYETQEEAEATRNALHGVQWPIGNGKMLIIDYATEEDMENAKNPPAPPPAAPVPDIKTAIKENMEPMENKSRSDEKISKEMEKKKIEGPVREWDIGKKDLRRDRSRSRERSRKHRRTPSPGEDFISRKQKKTEESVPQKLMDDLFLKTKATPSIYWQPLSPEEISMKQQQRLIRMEEHKRRMEENSRMKGRDMGRGAFRRRYD